MKYFICLLLFFDSTIILAEGNLQYRQYYDTHGKTSEYGVGLKVRENLLWNLYWSSWSGGGALTSGKDAWLKSEQAIEADIWRASFGAGTAADFIPSEHIYKPSLYLSFNAKLWN